MEYLLSLQSTVVVAVDSSVQIPRYVHSLVTPRFPLHPMLEAGSLALAISMDALRSLRQKDL